MSQELDPDEKNVILIFDEKGDYFCETVGTTRAAKITQANVSNVHRAANNGDIISTSDYFFVIKKLVNKTVPEIEQCLKIIIACNNTQGLANRINKVHLLIKSKSINN